MYKYKCNLMYEFKKLISNLRAFLNVSTFNFNELLVKYLHIIKVSFLGYNLKYKGFSN